MLTCDGQIEHVLTCDGQIERVLTRDGKIARACLMGGCHARQKARACDRKKARPRNVIARTLSIHLVKIVSQSHAARRADAFNAPSRTQDASRRGRPIACHRKRETILRQCTAPQRLRKRPLSRKNANGSGSGKVFEAGRDSRLWQRPQRRISQREREGGKKVREIYRRRDGERPRKTQ